MINEVPHSHPDGLYNRVRDEINEVLARTEIVVGDRLFPSPASPDNLSSSPDMKLVQRFYNRLTMALTSAGITERRLAEMPSSPELPFSFVYLEGEFIIDIAGDTLRITRTTHQPTGGFCQESFEVAADGNASYRNETFTVKKQQEFRSRVDSRISPDGGGEPQTTISNLQALTEQLEECTDNPEYSSVRIKQHLAVFYDDLVNHLSSVGIIRKQTSVKSDNRQIYIPGLGVVVPSFIEEGDTQGILLSQVREGIPVKQWCLCQGGNASVISQRRTTDGDQVFRRGRVQINDNGDFSFNHHLVYIELHQAMTTRIRSHAS